MKKEIITSMNSNFEDHAYEENGVEFWFARDLQSLLGYSEWRNFHNIIKKAKESCKNNGFGEADHFVEVNKTIPMPKGAEKEIPDIMLTRYACYLIAQNGDPKSRKLHLRRGVLHSHKKCGKKKMSMILNNYKKVVSFMGIERQNEEELKGNGYEGLSGKNLKSFKDSVQTQGVDEIYFVNIKKAPQLGIFDFVDKNENIKIRILNSIQE